jgi:hypothetical protein
VIGRTAHATRLARGNPAWVSHPELLPAFCVAFAVEVAHLRFVILTRWHCRSCGEIHLDCDCKPVWLKLLI